MVCAMTNQSKTNYANQGFTDSTNYDFTLGMSNNMSRDFETETELKNSSDVVAVCDFHLFSCIFVHAASTQLLGNL